MTLAIDPKWLCGFLSVLLRCMISSPLLCCKSSRKSCHLTKSRNICRTKKKLIKQLIFEKLLQIPLFVMNSIFLAQFSFFCWYWNFESAVQAIWLACIITIFTTDNFNKAFHCKTCQVSIGI